MPADPACLIIPESERPRRRHAVRYRSAAQPACKIVGCDILIEAVLLLTTSASPGVPALAAPSQAREGRGSLASGFRR